MGEELRKRNLNVLLKEKTVAWRNFLVVSRVPSTLALERIFCNVFTLASCAMVISCQQNPQHLGTPVSAEEDWNSTVEDADAGVPRIA